MLVSDLQVRGEGSSECIVARVKYAICADEAERRSHPQVRITRRPHGTCSSESSELFLFCPCRLMFRMLLPCRHVLAIALYAVREGQQDGTSNWKDALALLMELINSETVDNFLTKFINASIGVRWLHVVDRIGNTHGDPGSMEHEQRASVTNSTILGQWLQSQLNRSSTQSSFQFNIPQAFQFYSGNEDFRRGVPGMDTVIFGDMHPYFPVRSDGDGTPAAYGHFLSLSRRLADVLTCDTASLTVAAPIMSAMSNVLSAVVACQNKFGSAWFIDDKNRGELLTVALSAAMMARGPTDRPLLSQKDGSNGPSHDLSQFAPVFRDDPNISEIDGRRFRNRDTADRQKAAKWHQDFLPFPWLDSGPAAQPHQRSANEIEDRSGNNQNNPPDRHDEDEIIAERTTLLEDNRTTNNQVSATRSQMDHQATAPIRPHVNEHVRNPRRRAAKSRDPGHSSAHKMVRVKKRRKAAARQVPVRSRGEEHHSGGPPNIATPGTGTGWACPECTCIGVQHNRDNVLQHWRSSHCLSQMPEVDPPSRR